MAQQPERAACNGAEREFIPTERIGLIVWQLAHGEALTVNQVADIAGITYQGAWRMLEKLSRAIPILCFGGEWMPAVMAEALYVADFPDEKELPIE